MCNAVVMGLCYIGAIPQRHGGREFFNSESFDIDSERKHGLMEGLH